MPRRFTYKSWTNIEEFLSEGAYDDLRAIGGEFPTVKYTGTEIHARTDNRGLRIRVDLDEVADPNSPLAGGVAGYQARIVEKFKRAHPPQLSPPRHHHALRRRRQHRQNMERHRRPGPGQRHPAINSSPLPPNPASVRIASAWGDTAWRKRC